MLDSYFRNPYQKVCVEPIVKLSLIQSIHPGWITLLACLFGFIGSLCIAVGYSYSAIIVLLLSGYFDTLDGSIARRYKRTSPSGAVIDIVSDRLVEFCIIMGLFLVDPLRGLFCLLMLGSVLLCITSFLVVGIFTQNLSEKSFYYSPGLMERTEAFFFFITMILLPSLFTILAGIFSLLVFFTTIMRVYQFCWQIRELE